MNIFLYTCILAAALDMRGHMYHYLLVDILYIYTYIYIQMYVYMYIYEYILYI